MTPIYIGVPLVWLFRSVRGFRKAQTQIRESLADLDVALLRRHDLVLKLARAVQPHFEHERNVVSDALHYHERAMATRWNVSEHGRDEARLDGAIDTIYEKLSRINLNGDARFLADLKREFASSDKHVALAVRSYNDRVAGFNASLQTFPTSWIGKTVMHLRPEPAYNTTPQIVKGVAASGIPLGRARTPRV